MNQIVIGTYELGYEKVELVLREGIGGEFYFIPGDINCPRIKIGADQDSLWKLVSILYHEVGELVLARLGCRYEPADQVGSDIHSYTFIISHVQFSNMCAMIADYVTRCLEDLTNAWSKWKEETK